MSDKLIYIVDICTFIPSSGGICTMHRLCHELNALGETAYITSPITHPSLNAPYVGNRKFKKEEIVVIYPEITHSNPLSAKNVVRWILNVPGDSFYAAVSTRDLIFKYSESYKLKKECKHHGLLRTTFSDKLGLFFDAKESRKGSAFLVKKGGMKEKIHPDDSIDLSQYANDHEAMANIFRRIEYFYCYDSYCFLTCLATMCGCITVMTPPEGVSFEEYTTCNPQMKYGVAYGEDNIQHAKDTIHLVPGNNTLVKEQELNTVKNFIELCNNHFKK